MKARGRSFRSTHVNFNGQRASSERETTIHLPISDEHLDGDGSVSWRLGIKLGGAAYQRLDGALFTIRTDQDELPVMLVMDCADARTLLVSEEEGTATVELPMRLELDRGREFVHDENGRAQGAIDRTFATLSWDRSRAIQESA